LSTVNRIFFDVIVIGSGPAGCAAAGICTRAGLNVIIVTDQPKPDPFPALVPVPLESIHPGVSSLLVKIGAEGAELDATMALYSGIMAGGVYNALGEDSNGIWQGMHINRELFNARMLHLVKYLGMNVMLNQSVDRFLSEDGKVTGIKTRFADLHAKYIIDASGKKAIAGKLLKFKRRFFSPPLVCWTGVSEIDGSFPYDHHAAHFIPGKTGWTWLAPQPPNYCSWTRLSVKGEKSFLPPDELNSYPTIGKINVANMRWRLYSPVCTEGIVLCGDAAGILDPAAGQGIFNALSSGIVAANTVIKCIQQTDLASFYLAQYDDWFVREFEGKVQNLKIYYAYSEIKLLYKDED